MAKVNVYIDGFNLYYGAVKGSPFKWLDLSALCRRMLPGDVVQSIEYFTARLSVATFMKRIRQSELSVCQFPAVLTDAKGQFHKPSTW